MKFRRFNLRTLKKETLVVKVVRNESISSYFMRIVAQTMIKHKTAIDHWTSTSIEAPESFNERGDSSNWLHAISLFPKCVSSFESKNECSQFMKEYNFHRNEPGYNFYRSTVFCGEATSCTSCLNGVFWTCLNTYQRNCNIYI